MVNNNILTQLKTGRTASIAYEQSGGSVTARVTSLLEREKLSALIIIAEKNSDDQLINIESFPQEINAQSCVSVNKTADVGNKAEVYLWNDFKNLNPITEKAQ